MISDEGKWDVARELGVSKHTIHDWKASFSTGDATCGREIF
jgi:hypothetical protein